MPLNDNPRTNPLLIFAHIEKSAGTSFRALLWKNWGRECVLWYGLDVPFGTDLSRLALDPYKAVGGHFDIPWVDRIPDPTIESAVIRDPVERAVSLFQYFAVSGPPEVKQRWRRRGLRADSLRKTLFFCLPFRRAVKNVQCKRLSGSRSFKRVERRYASRSYIVGSFDDLPMYCRTVGNLFGWQRMGLPRINVAPKAYVEETLSDRDVRETLERLNRHDLALKRWIDEHRVRMGGNEIERLRVRPSV